MKAIIKVTMPGTSIDGRSGFGLIVEDIAMSGREDGGTNGHPEDADGPDGNSLRPGWRVDPAGHERCVPEAKAVDPESGAGFNADDYYGDLGWEAELHQENPDPERVEEWEDITPEQVAQWLAMADAHWEMLKKVKGVPRAIFDEFCDDLRRMARNRWFRLRCDFQRFCFECRLG